MGSLFSSSSAQNDALESEDLSEPLDDGVERVEDEGDPDPGGSLASRKRLRSSDHSSDADFSEDVFHTPKRKKMTSTIDHIYKKLFLEGQGSDVTIEALGEAFCLHKVYLSQCDYFSSMFSGRWAEGDGRSVIRLDVPDPRVTVQALRVTFGSLYRDEVSIRPVDVVSVLATASLLQLEGLRDQCNAVMADSLCRETVCCYYEAAQTYGLPSLADIALKWLENHVLGKYDAALLKQIGSDLMGRLIQSPNLVVMQVEPDVYTMFKKWVFVQCCPDFQDSGDIKSLAKAADRYFRDYSNSSKSGRHNKAFLDGALGSKFAPVAKKLRLHHLVGDGGALSTLARDRLISQKWFFLSIAMQWTAMLQIEQGKDLGPTKVDRSTFDADAVRSARVLPDKGEFCWRWGGYKYGIDLLVYASSSSDVIRFKRNMAEHQVNQRCVSLDPQRSFAYRLRVLSFDANGMCTYEEQTEIKYIKLKPGETATVFKFPKPPPFPLHICLSVLFTSPHKHKKSEDNLMDKIVEQASRHH